MPERARRKSRWSTPAPPRGRALLSLLAVLTLVQRLPAWEKAAWRPDAARVARGSDQTEPPASAANAPPLTSRKPVGSLHQRNGDSLLLVVDEVPPDGLVLGTVDLTAALRWTRCAWPEEGRLTAVGVRSRRRIPCQFVPAPDFDPSTRAAGTVVLECSPELDEPLRLEWQEEPEPKAAASWDGRVVTPWFVVRHDAQSMGGLPAEVRFAKDNKTVRLSWNDRAFHPEPGGFFVRNDRAARVELLADGPLCAVVRVRARYCASNGRQPDSKPTVVYDWYYFKKRPLVFVKAEVRQAEPTTWREVHFLELHQPGNDLLRWAGGEPVQRGRFSGTPDSKRFADWAAVLDGFHVVAVVSGGQVLVYDGLGGYGPYLHARATQAWTAWTATSRSYTAWLTVGSSDDPEAWVRNVAGQPLPTDSHVTVTVRSVHERVVKAKAEAKRDLQQSWQAGVAEQLERQGRFSEAVQVLEGRLPKSWHRLTAGQLEVVLECTRSGIRVVSLFDRRAGRELAAADQPPLFDSEGRPGRLGPRARTGCWSA